MRKNSNLNSENNAEEQNINEKECFVIMPISDRLPYKEGHFKIVYEYLIKPACEKAGFTSIRADEVKESNYIVKDILKRILNSDMAICDLSGQNPNVLFELGIRQAFNKPVTIIKDLDTSRIFDIEGIRCVNYDGKLRVDNINGSINEIAVTLKNTFESRGNSLIESLRITPAQVPQDRVLSNDTSILLEAIKDINEQLASIKDNSRIDSKAFDSEELFIGSAYRPKFRYVYERDEQGREFVSKIKNERFPLPNKEVNLEQSNFSDQTFSDK